ncbi:ABC1 kinase family protein [Kitasatospora sp. NPDC050543]|uniref:ABC1 kinase family protein n=1 Tax=Kitasatospora sp. NPDC050543 TaxID=3364054 RepID=UPI003787D374
MTISLVLALVAGVSINTFLLAFGARRLLDAHFSLTRTVIAGACGQAAANPVITGLVGKTDPDDKPGVIVLFVGLGWACALLIAMIILVLWEAFVPAGTATTPLTWLRGLRARAKRTRRYWQITRILARNGFGPYLRGRARPGQASAQDQAHLARALSSALEQGGVTFVKLGQVLSTRRDMLPPAFVTELARLQDRAAPVPWEELEPALRAELGAPVEEVFAAFDRSPLASASIAQVHVARLRTGEEVVVKVQRPGVRATVERDLEIVGRLARSIHRRGGWGRSIGVLELAEGFATALREELDFLVETRNMTAVAAAAHARGDGSRVRIPEPYPDLCTVRVLVMERLAGTPLAKAGPLIGELGLDRRDLAGDLLATLLRQVTLDGVFHADPHPGNILLLTDGRLGLLDFGSVGRLDSELQAALQRLMIAMNRADPVALTDALLEVVSRPDGLDEQGLERALGAFMARHLGPGSAPDVQLFTALFRIVARYDLSVPPELAAVFRALATLEGGLTHLAPGFDLVAEARRFGEKHLAERLRPASLKEAAGDELLALLPMLRRLPRRLDRIAAAVEGGRFGMNVRLLADERDRRTVNGLLQQVLLTVLAATAGIMAVLLLGLKDGPTLDGRMTVHQFLGYCLLVICSVLALRVLILIFRPARR